MSIGDASGRPDDKVPGWVLAARQRARRQLTLLCATCQCHFGIRKEVEQHCAETGHVPLVEVVKCS